MAEHILVSMGKRLFANPTRKTIPFVEDDAQNTFLNDIERYPHAYVLACLMDRQIKAERAWSIPYRIMEITGSFDIRDLETIPLDIFTGIFRDHSLHRFNDMMAEVFYSAIHDIAKRYSGDVSRIWSHRPSSAKVVYEFLQFKGSGVKIATMAANILALQFKVPFSDYYSIDISPDVHIIRVISRTGLVSPDAGPESIIYKARELCPEFPGIIDFSCWEIGRRYCRPINPDCSDCSITEACQKVI